jgi:hypothetical protein
MNEYLTELWAIPVSALLLMSPVWLSVLFVWGRDRLSRSACRYRHPSSVGRRARIVADRRAMLNRKGSR